MPRTRSSSSTSRWLSGKRKYRQTAWLMISPGHPVMFVEIGWGGHGSSIGMRFVEEEHTPDPRSSLWTAIMPHCVEAG